MAKGPKMNAPTPLDDLRWRAVQARDAAQDGAFFYAVATTGVYCFPSCAARPARRENVSFHATRAAAETAGFRACLRCRPDLPPRAEREAALAADACRRIDGEEAEPSLARLAQAAGLSPHHFHRLFSRVVGMTPKAYARAHRGARLRAALGDGANVTRAVTEAGFGSTSRAHAAMQEMLGMSAQHYRKGGAHERISFTIRPCSLGLTLIAATDRGVCAILFGDAPEAMRAELAERFPKAEIGAGDARFETLADEALRRVEASGGVDNLPLDVRGTAFQHRVWKALRDIPRGTTTTYSDVARRIGDPKATRAVAGACAANPLGVLTPCHRVLRSDGSLSGYYWGVERKRALLGRERDE